MKPVKVVIYSVIVIACLSRATAQSNLVGPPCQQVITMETYCNGICGTEPVQESENIVTFYNTGGTQDVLTTNCGSDITTLSECSSPYLSAKTDTQNNCPGTSGPCESDSPNDCASGYYCATDNDPDDQYAGFCTSIAGGSCGETGATCQSMTDCCADMHFCSSNKCSPVCQGDNDCTDSGGNCMCNGTCGESVDLGGTCGAGYCNDPDRDCAGSMACISGNCGYECDGDSDPNCDAATCNTSTGAWDETRCQNIGCSVGQDSVCASFGGNCMCEDISGTVGTCGTSIGQGVTGCYCDSDCADGLVCSSGTCAYECDGSGACAASICTASGWDDSACNVVPSCNGSGDCARFGMYPSAVGTIVHATTRMTVA